MVISQHGGVESPNPSSIIEREAEASAAGLPITQRGAGADHDVPHSIESKKMVCKTGLLR